MNNHGRGSKPPGAGLSARPGKWTPAIWAVFLGVICTASYVHEPWRDEYQALLLSNASSSFADVVWRARYEGHPSLWYLILYLVPNSGCQVAIAKALAVGIMAAAGWLLAFRAPFANATKAGLLFGYYFCFEYSAFFRQYGIAVLLFFAAIHLLNSPRSDRQLIAILPLALLPFTQVYGALLSLGLFSCMVYMRWRGARAWPKRACVVAAAAYLLAFAVAAWDMMPPTDGNFHGSWSLEGGKLLYAMTIPAKAFLPFPAFPLRDWDHTLLAAAASHAAPAYSEWILTAVSAFLITAAAITLRSSGRAQVLFLGSSLLILAFCAVRYHGGLRHQGMIFMAYIGALWMARSERSAQAREPLAAVRLFLPAILLVQVAAGLAMIGADVLHPFSGAAGTAQFLRETGRGGSAIYSACEDRGIALAGALDRPVYYPSIHREATYMEWNDQRQWGIPEDEHLAEYSAMAAAKPTLLFLCTEPLTEEQMARFKLVLIHRDPPTIRADESFLLYERRP